MTVKTHFKTLERKAYVKNGAVRLIFASLAIILEVLWLYFLATRLYTSAPWLSTLASFAALIVAVVVYGRRENAAMKMMWMMLIISFPPLGVVLYLLTGLTGSTVAMKRRFNVAEADLSASLPVDEAQLKAVSLSNPQAAGIPHYISRSAHFPLYRHTAVAFHPDPLTAFEALKKDLSRAERFIFMEYYAIEDSTAFNEIRSILKERAKAGVEVRLFYDDIGSIFFINTDFVQRMESDGIRCRVFNPMLPIANILMNNRDHRKMTVIDGRIGYTGGYNLADEYFHLKQPYGYWKDSGVRLEGPAVCSLTHQFLIMWNAIRSHDLDDHDFSRYFPDVKPLDAPGFVQPYGDSPLDNENVGENVYMSILNSAEHCCWFMTPYLIITDEMVRAFTLAAKRGVDVRIVTPGIPDKKITYRVTRSSYRQLAQSGVRIYEYTPGFCHAKQCVCDDRLAVCGTINLDYRSLYHHFEDAVFMMDTSAVVDIRRDFENVFAQSREVTSGYVARPSAAVHLHETLLRLIAPLL